MRKSLDQDRYNTKIGLATYSSASCRLEVCVNFIGKIFFVSFPPTQKDSDLFWRKFAVPQNQARKQDFPKGIKGSRKFFFFENCLIYTTVLIKLVLLRCITEFQSLHPSYLQIKVQNKFKHLCFSLNFLSDFALRRGAEIFLASLVTPCYETE